MTMKKKEKDDNTEKPEQGKIDETAEDTTTTAILNNTMDTTTIDMGKQIEQKLSTIPGLELSGEGFNTQLIDYLIKSVARLSTENAMLKKVIQTAQKGDRRQLLSDKHESQPQSQVGDEDATKLPETPIFEEYHLVWCAGTKRNYFRDVPRMFKGDMKSDHLRGLRGMENMSKHLEKHKHMAFAVVHQYNCSCAGGPDYHRRVGYKDGKIIDDSPPAESEKKHIVAGQAIERAMKDIMHAHHGCFKGYKEKPPKVFYEPFLFFYAHNKTLLELADNSKLDDFDSQSIKLLCSWFEKHCRKDWDEADELFSRGKVTTKHFPKLFRPGELMLNPRRFEQSLIWVYKVKDYPWRDIQDGEADVYWWLYNGLFQKIDGVIDTSLMVTQDGFQMYERDGEVDITTLRVYPLRFAKTGMHEKLIARGNKFWGCRKKKLVSYTEPASEGDGISKPVELRVMVDYNMFRRIHPKKAIFLSQADDLGTEAMNRAEPPSDEFLAMLPPQLHAFDFSAKGFRLIRVDHITDVTWNKDAFKRLVVPGETKELIQAAVTAHGHHLSVAPDIIADKGQGLLILLHGGPGTGKTLTAESIAEAQERPLYRVTCGDIGVEPSAVERYLQSVLTIGKAWECVVLLDEADVFLEERNVADQRQNAIVSVFLRVLEYYDGILILTTNRVGTFDEAFKSRIHLALRYSNLDEDQRVEIWRNFIRMLAKTKERVDIDDLELNVHKLAQVELNGRQIRNVITLARYLAKFRKQMLVYKHVQDAFASVVKFDEYLNKLRGSDDRWATESRLR